MTLFASSRSIARTTTVLTGALLSLLGYGCQTGSSSQAGLISVDTCEECAPAYDECVNAGKDNCEPMMQECFAECAPPTPTDPGDCSCHDLFDECMGQQPTPPDCEDRPDGSTACDDPGTGDQGTGDQGTGDQGTGDQGTDPGDGQRWECETIYQQCAQACNEPTPPSECQQCDGILGECFESAKESDDPVSVLGECLAPYVQCEVECKGDGDDEPTPGSECGSCNAELDECLGSGDIEIPVCFERNLECRSKCEGTGGDDEEPTPDGEGLCWESYELCVDHCGEDTTREGCEEALENCLSH